MNEVIKSLTERRSWRKYKAEQIKPEELDAVLEAGKYAPTAMGQQSQIMVAVQDPEVIAKLAKMNAAVNGNPNNPFYGAPTVIVVLAKADALAPVQDGTLCMANMLNAAHALGLGSCWVNRAKEVFATDEGKELLRSWGIDGEYVGVANCILGYPDGDTPVPAPRKENFVYRV